jgi:hypothetical protein
MGSPGQETIEDAQKLGKRVALLIKKLKSN